MHLFQKHPPLCDLSVRISLLLSCFQISQFSRIYRIGGEIESLAVTEYCWEKQNNCSHAVVKSGRTKVNERGVVKKCEVFTGSLNLHDVCGQSNCLIPTKTTKPNTVSSYYLFAWGKGNQCCPLKHHPCYCIMFKL